MPWMSLIIWRSTFTVLPFPCYHRLPKPVLETKKTHHFSLCEFICSSSSRPLTERKSEQAREKHPPKSKRLPLRHVQCKICFPKWLVRTCTHDTHERPAVRLRRVLHQVQEKESFGTSQGGSSQQVRLTTSLLVYISILICLLHNLFALSLLDTQVSKVTSSASAAHTTPAVYYCVRTTRVQLLLDVSFSDTSFVTRLEWNNFCRSHPWSRRLDRFASLWQGAW